MPRETPRYTPYQTAYRTWKNGERWRRRVSLAEFNRLVGIDAMIDLEVNDDTQLVIAPETAITALQMGPGNDLLLRATAMIHNDAETAWINSGCPYYNSSPNIMPSLLRANLSLVTSDMLEVPDDYSTVTINLPRDGPRIPMGSPYLAALRERLPHSNWPEQTYLDSVMLHVETHRETGLKKMHFMLQDMSTREMLTELSREPNGRIFHLFALSLTVMLPMDGRSLETHFNYITENGVFRNPEELAVETIDQAHQRVEGVRSALHALLNLVSTIGFLARGNRDLFAFDVLTSDQEAYRRGDEETRARLERRARDTGRIGWNVGNDFLIDEADYVPKGTARGNGTGNERRWAHIRGSHWHAYRCGPGRTKIKMYLMRAIPIRKDLPFKPMEAPA